MAQEDTSFRDLVARLNAMSNLTPEEERMQMMESVGKAPKVLDDKEVTLADIAKLAGIKEYVAPVKHSKKAEKMVESITAEPKLESSIAKAIKESDADVSISKQIKEAVTKESNRLDKIAELETQLAELKQAEKEDATMDDKAFREAFVSEIAEYAKEAEANDLVELYNKFSANEVEMNENEFTIKTPETAEIIADAGTGSGRRRIRSYGGRGSDRERFRRREPSVPILPRQVKRGRRGRRTGHGWRGGHVGPRVRRGTGARNTGGGQVHERPRPGRQEVIT